MKVEFKVEGGVAFFPGLAKPLTIDTGELAEEESAELVRLVQAAHFFDLPAIASVPSPGAADYRQYTITVEDKGRHHTVSFADPVNNRSLLALRSCLQAKVLSRRHSR